MPKCDYCHLFYAQDASDAYEPEVYCSLWCQNHAEQNRYVDGGGDEDERNEVAVDPEGEE